MVGRHRYTLTSASAGMERRGSLDRCEGRATSFKHGCCPRCRQCPSESPAGSQWVTRGPSKCQQTGDSSHPGREGAIGRRTRGHAHRSISHPSPPNNPLLTAPQTGIDVPRLSSHTQNWHKTYLWQREPVSCLSSPTQQQYQLAPSTGTYLWRQKLVQVRCTECVNGLELLGGPAVG